LVHAAERPQLVDAGGRGVAVERLTQVHVTVADEPFDGGVVEHRHGGRR
jgi:hypothetical protein